MLSPAVHPLASTLITSGLVVANVPKKSGIGSAFSTTRSTAIAGHVQ